MRWKTRLLIHFLRLDEDSTYIPNLVSAHFGHCYEETGIVRNPPSPVFPFRHLTILTVAEARLGDDPRPGRVWTNVLLAPFGT